MMEWVKCSDREPDTDRKILVYDGEHHVAWFNSGQSTGWYRYDCDTYDVSPTHWAELLEPPKV